jgi:hypothetical protein
MTLEDEIKDDPYIAIGTMTLGDISLDLYNCRICKTTVSKEYVLSHYKKHYPKETGVKLPEYIK